MWWYDVWDVDRWCMWRGHFAFLSILSNLPCCIKRGIAIELKYVFNLRSSLLSLSQENFHYFFHNVCDGGPVSWIMPRMSWIMPIMSKSRPNCQISYPEYQKAPPVVSYINYWTDQKTCAYFWPIFCVNAVFINTLWPRNL